MFISNQNRKLKDRRVHWS